MKFNYKSKVVKVVAFTLLFSLLNQTLTPAVVFALTSGPTSPETNSFEPVDSSDMVNMATGDFVYNLPLLEVPGPEGGYPLTLSYHGGVQPDEDSGWVGLGWSLNPGAINRSVFGFPDDWYGSQSSRRDYWIGGTTTKTSIGINVPVFGPTGWVGFGISVRKDTYKGVQWGGSVSATLGVPNSIASIGFGLGIDPDEGMYEYTQIGGGVGPFSATLGFNSITGPYAGVGVGLMWSKNSSAAITQGLNLSTNFKSVDVSAGTRLSYNVQGIGISTGYLQPSLSASGPTSSLSNSRAGLISSFTGNVSRDYIFFNYSQQKTRYWSDEKEISTVFGSLHQMNYLWGDVPDTYTYDNYSLPDSELTSGLDDNDANRVQGGSLPSYDNYQVTAQGIGGTMRPYAFNQITVNQNRDEKNGVDPAIRKVNYFVNYIGDYPEFRFDNDFSNNYLQSYGDYPNVNNEIYLWNPPFTAPTPMDVDWYNGGSYSNNLAGSRHINYYVTTSNGTVHNYDNKFITPVALGLNRRSHTTQSSLNNHIAGFSITNSNGVTYHYNLPAYAYDEESYQERTTPPLSPGDSFNRQKKSEGYAYTWHLTAVTGPDYVDRGTVGQLDAADYGYWVSFEYGKWSNQYCWRNPAQGFHADEDSEFRHVSMGKREIYYLNAVRTRSHVAIFEKDSRKDGKGASPEIYNTPNGRNYGNDGLFNANSTLSMRLDKIYLLNAADAGYVTSSSTSDNYPNSARTVPCTDCELPDNIIDKYDVNAVGRYALELKSIRIINFNYDYSLVPGTTNSFDFSSPGTKEGKLTLKSVNFRGKEGTNLLPPTSFEYEFDQTESKPFSGTLSPSSFYGSSTAFEVGDLLVNSGNGTFCGVVMAKSAPSSGNSTYTLKNSNYAGGSISASLKKTKNPPYNKDNYDLWGMYKSDCTPANNNNLDRATTPISNMSTDVWSLRKIVSALGAEIKIKYEGDTYSKSVLNESRPFQISNFVYDGGYNYHFTVSNSNMSNLADLFRVGDHISLLTFQESGNVYNAYSSDDYPAPVITAVSGNQINIRVAPLHSGAWNMSNNNIIGGNLGFSSMSRKYGGGIRTKSISIDDLLGVKSATNYKYNQLDANTESEVSSGVTSYEPISVDKSTSFPVTAQLVYQSLLYKDMDRLLALSKDVPGPGVMYEYVTTENEVFDSSGALNGKMSGKRTVVFEVFRENMIGKQDVTAPRSAAKDANSNYYTRNLVLKKFLSGIGSMKRMITYDDKGRKLNETINHFLSDGLEHLKHADFMDAYELRLAEFKKQGLLKERYSEAKAVRIGNTNDFHIKATLTARESYPNIQTGQTVIDHVTNVSRSTVNKQFDFYSGDATRTITTDSYGNRFMTEVIPAYRKYADMGLKHGDANRKQMLSQITGTYTYKVDGNNDPLGLVGANVSTWGTDVSVLDPNGATIIQDNATTNGKVWRKKSQYSWSPSGSTSNGITPMVNVAAFNWADPGLSNAAWLKVGENTLFDVYSKPLESKDMNNLFSAMRMGHNNTKIVASTNPANYYESAYSGAEDNLSGSGMVLGDGYITNSYAHTGSRSLALGSYNGQIFKYTVPLSKLDGARDYYISAWVTGSNVNTARLYYSVNGQPPVYGGASFQKTAGGWYLIEMHIPASVISGGTNNISVGCSNLTGGSTLYFDDFRFHPFNAGMISYVYDAFSGELTHLLDNNNLYSKYEYDAAGRLIRVYREVLGKSTIPKIKEIQYNYKKVNL